jgi:hypothetical protein
MLGGGGGGGGGCKSAEVGLLDTVNAKCSKATLVEVLSTSDKFKKCVLPQLYKESLKDFEGSEENMLRCAAVYYGGGIMGKRKYRQVYRDVFFQKLNNNKKYGKRIAINNCPIPLLVPYNKLMPFVKSINIGTIYSTYDTLCSGLQEDDKIQGCYRSIKELLVMLAEFYLVFRPADLVWFDEANKLYVTLGGDGAPFGKYDTACAWLVSF